MTKTNERLLTRRDFLRVSGLALTGLGYGCATLLQPSDPQKRCEKAIYHKWCRTGPSKKESFNQSLQSYHDSTPGITYQTGKTMVASADGCVIRIQELHTGRAGGLMVKVSHGVEHKSPYGESFITYYAHLDDVFVDGGQKIRRGAPIGTPKVFDFGCIPKLVLNIHDNLANPNNYGFNHGCMPELNEELSARNLDMNIETMEEKWYNQEQIIKEFYNMLDIARFDWINKTHNKYRRVGAIARWSLIEHMRYFDCLFKKEPERFKGMTPEQFQKVSKNFYDNQPLVLTVPFK